MDVCFLISELLRYIRKIKTLYLRVERYLCIDINVYVPKDINYNKSK